MVSGLSLLRLYSHLIRAQERVAADHSKELLPADATFSVVVVLTEKVFHHQTSVTYVSSHVFHHVRLDVARVSSNIGLKVGDSSALPFKVDFKLADGHLCSW